MMTYTCQICGSATDWDSSVGRPSFIVCNHCTYAFAKRLNIDPWYAMQVFLEIGNFKENLEERKKGEN